MIKVVEIMSERGRKSESVELTPQGENDYAYAPVIYMTRRRFWDWLVWLGFRKKIELLQKN